MMTNQEQIKCFGDTIEGLNSAVKRMYNARDLQMYAMGIISDAQYVMEHNPEQARQFMNKAKYYLGKIGSELREIEQAGNLTPFKKEA